ncbi:hypothetical protein [Aliiruegeria lutimaris]|uniref:hypothetical protein n=1 Tax=Aliiruegeria lutimaris TaxID=571298 RepID=UPI00147A80D0|nr:hypothetical protein [Aliiruegeria lutimaris]
MNDVNVQGFRNLFKPTAPFKVKQSIVFAIPLVNSDHLTETANRSYPWLTLGEQDAQRDQPGAGAAAQSQDRS